jgi:GNAT superfamily N-acetyltransferase
MWGVPIVGDIDHPERRTLTDENGLPIARFVHAERDNRTVADLLELEVPVERALPYIARELRGRRIAGPEALGRALVARGARLQRHSHAYTHDLVALPTLDTTYELTPVDRPASELLPVYLTAFGDGHPDRMAPSEAARHLEGIVAGKLGGLLPASGLAIAGDRVVAAILIGTITDAPPPLGGPWIMEVFSTARGAGRALLIRALHRGEGSLGLAVTEGNPAIRVYESLGFRRTFTAYSVDL